MSRITLNSGRRRSPTTLSFPPFFPLLLGLVSVAAFFIEPQTATDRITEALGNYVPQSGQVEQAVQGMVSSRGAVGAFSLVTLLWTGSRVFSALIQALNAIYLVDDGYSFPKRVLISVAMTLSLGIGIVLALGSGLILGLLRTETGFLSFLPGVLFSLINWLIRLTLLIGIFYLIYQYVPKGKQDRRASLVGAVGATLIFLIARPLFAFYIQEFGRQNAIYGPMAVVIVALLWIWISALIMLFGGELAAHTRGMLVAGEAADAIGKRHQDRVAL